MDRSIYDAMAAHDSTHWWYRGRREVLGSVIARLVALPPDPAILEIGCGTGHNLEMLGRFGRVDAVEIDAAARAVAEARLGRAISGAPLPDLTGIAARGYDLVALLDVLEHVEDDRAALTAIGERLRPGGALLLAVPQHGWLWSGHDVANHHHRRYSKASLRRVIAAAGLKLTLLQSFNSLLFPLAAIDRGVARLTGRAGGDDTPPSRALNTLFERVFAFERHLVGRVPMPTGVSLIALIEA